MDNILDVLQLILIWAIPILFAVTLHEAAHGWLASKLGDKTALFMGRVTLNPLKHVDLVGTVIVPLIFLFFSLYSGRFFLFGWAKPVPVEWRNLRNPRRDMALVAAIGPGANLLMALIWAGITKIFMELLKSGFQNGKALVYMGLAGVSINLMLMVLNLIPIPPLDGSRVVSSLLTPNLARKYQMIEQFGFMILILLLFSGILNYILIPAITFLQNIILTLFGIV